jgi:hypothetical protein
LLRRQSSPPFAKRQFAALTFAGRSILITVKPDTKQFHSVVDKPEAKFGGDLPLERFKFGIDKFDDLASFDVDHMVMVGLGRCLIPGAAIAEIMPIKNASFFEQAYRSINSCDRNAWIHCHRALVQSFNIGMVGAFG